MSMHFRLQPCSHLTLECISTCVSSYLLWSDLTSTLHIQINSYTQDDQLWCMLIPGVNIAFRPGPALPYMVPAECPRAQTTRGHQCICTYSLYIFIFKNQLYQGLNAEDPCLPVWLFWLYYSVTKGIEVTLAVWSHSHTVNQEGGERDYLIVVLKTRK